MITHSDSIGKLAAALSAVQGALGTVTKDSTAKIASKKEGASFTYSYADLGAVWTAIRKPLSDAGLALIQAPMLTDDGVDVLVTTLAHADSGEWIRSVTRLPVHDLSDPKALGSSITYMRRYSLMSLLGIVTDDDDGTTAAGQRGTYGRKGQPQRNTPAPRQADVAQPTPEQADEFDDPFPPADKVSAEVGRGIVTALRPLKLSPAALGTLVEGILGHSVNGIASLTSADGAKLAEFTTDDFAQRLDEMRTPA